MPNKRALRGQWTRDGVKERLGFARRRLNDLQTLNQGDLAGAPGPERQQLVQEFFFHLVGAIEFLAQEINIARQLGIDPEEVDSQGVCKALQRRGDPIGELLSRLHPKTRNTPMPSDPYSDQGSLFRIALFRNFVSHIGKNPFNLEMDLSMPAAYAIAGQPSGAGVAALGSTPSRAQLFIDPRDLLDGRSTASKFDALVELGRFLDFVTSGCQNIMSEL